VLLLGVLVTLGVIILLATPGPWHRVVPAVASRPPLAPPPPPRDIAIYLEGPGAEGCAGAIWLHIDYDLPEFTAAVVPARLACYQPGAGLQPLATIVDDAGPKAATKALSETLSVSFGSWLEIDPLSVRAALPGFITQYSQLIHPRALPLAGVWSTGQPSTLAFTRQIAYLRDLLREGVADQVNLVGFVNYILGSRDVSTGLTLQAASAVGAALDLSDAGDLVTTSLPVTVARRGAYERWRAQGRALLALRLALEFDATSPVYGATVAATTPSPTVDVLTSPLGRWAAVYRAAFARALRSYGARGVRVEMIRCATPGAATRALSGARRSSLGVVVAVGRTATGAPTVSRTTAVVRAALAAVREAQLPAVVSQAPDAGVAVNGAIAAQATLAGLPLSPVAAALAARAAAASASASPSAGPSAASSVAATASPSPGTTASASPSAGMTAAASPGATAAGRPSPAPTTTIGPLAASVVTAWARLDAATFVRAVQPEFFAPRLPAAGLGVTYYQRTLTKVVVAGPAAAADRLATRLQVDGWAAQRAPASTKPVGETTVYYSGGDRRLARALAGDLGLHTAQIVRSPGGSRPLTVVLPG
jgi:hypothetical protein